MGNEVRVKTAMLRMKFLDRNQWDAVIPVSAPELWRGVDAMRVIDASLKSLCPINRGVARLVAI